MKTLSPSQKFVEALVLAQLKQYIDVIVVLKEVLKLHNILVLNGAMDFNLTHELLFCT